MSDNYHIKLLGTINNSIESTNSGKFESSVGSGDCDQF